MKGNTVENWIRLKVTAPREYLDDLIAVMSMIENSLQIDDYSDIGEELLDGVYGDLIDEELLAQDRSVASVSIYIPIERSPAESSAFLEKRFAELDIPAKLELIGVDEEDWANSWKKYYKPIKTGNRLVIVPMWEEYTPAADEITVIMNPGMAFGTGTHETTRLCAALLEDYINEGDSMLDVGCGSGILAICAARLGANDCFACDIDAVAVRVAEENARLNDTPNVKAEVSDLLKSVPDKKYNVICANIVADVIIRLAPDAYKYLAPGGTFIVSGIIDTRADEVKSALKNGGYEIIAERGENGWYAAAVTHA